MGVGSEDTVYQPVAVSGAVCAGASGAHGCRGLSCRQTGRAIAMTTKQAGMRQRRKPNVLRPARQHRRMNTIARFCAAVGGVIETRHTYTYEDGSSYVKVDCETDTTVYEGGLDKRSSLDSLQQALFFQCPDRQAAGCGHL